MSTTPEGLIEEVHVRDLIFRFSRALDLKDWTAYADAFEPDASFDIMGQRRTGRDSITAGPARDLDRYDALQHFVANQRVQIDGDVARGGWYAICVHVPDRRTPDQHADVGVRYRFEASRTAGIWRFSQLVLELVWTAGLPFGVEAAPGP
jgi:uncharacterized protein (TIGR02246 family)